jgi:hypothetical protein
MPSAPRLTESPGCQRKRRETCDPFQTCTGHGHFDLASYQMYLSGSLQDYALPAEMIKASLSELPEIRL